MTWDAELAEAAWRRELAGRMGGPEKRSPGARRRAATTGSGGRLLDEGSFREIGELAGKASYNGDGTLDSFTAANFVAGTADRRAQGRGRR